MKRITVCLILLVLAFDVHGDAGGPPARPRTGLLSFSLTPCAFTSLWPNDRPNGGYREWIGPGAGLTLSCRYLPPSRPLFIGVDIGCSMAIVPYSWAMSILQAGLSAGFQSDPRQALGLRLFGSGGYSLNSIQAPDRGVHITEALLPSRITVATGGTPYVGAGAELSLSITRNLSVAAGVRVRYLFDLFADVGGTLGISIDIPFGEPRVRAPHSDVALLADLEIHEPGADPAKGVTEGE